MKNARDSLIVTNNPLLAQCMEGCCEIRLFPECSYREILVKVRDLVYAGPTLYTHRFPAASNRMRRRINRRRVKWPHAFSQSRPDIPNASSCDKFTPRDGGNLPKRTGGLSTDRLYPACRRRGFRRCGRP